MTDSTPSYQDLVLTIQLKPILAAQEKHGPIFRRELFDFAYAASLTITDEDTNELVDVSDDRRYVTLLDIHGVEQESFVPKEGVITERHNKPYETKRAWMYCQVQNLGLHWGKAEVDWKLIPFYFHTIDVPIEEKEEPLHPGFDKMTAQWREEWEASSLHAHLTAFLEKHAGGAMQRVDQIICFGMGRPFPQ